MPLLFLSNAPATNHLVKNIFHHLKICSPQLRAGHQQIICFPCQFRIIFYNGSEYRIGWSRVKIQSWKWKNYTTTQKLSTVEASGPNFTFMDKHRFLHSSLQRCEAAIKQKNVYFYPVKDDKPSCTLWTQKCYPFFFTACGYSKQAERLQLLLVQHHWPEGDFYFERPWRFQTLL